MKASDIDISWLRDHIAYEPDTGRFLSKGGRFYFDGSIRRLPKEGEPLCQVVDGEGYLEVRFSVVREKAHRLAWALHFGRWPNNTIDHIDGDRKNNRIVNLRDVTNAVNLQNVKGARAGSRTGLLGAHPLPNGKFKSSIVVAGRRTWLGTFTTAEQAHLAYITAKRKLHKGNTL